MVEGNHWDQWFSDGFGVRQPLVTMVFDGCGPLVRRWNGYVPSLKSKTDIDRLTQDKVGWEIKELGLDQVDLCLSFRDNDHFDFAQVDIVVSQWKYCDKERFPAVKGMLADLAAKSR